VLLRVRRSVTDRTIAARTSDGGVARGLLAGFGDVLRRYWARVVVITVFLEGVALFGPFAFLASHLHRVYALPLSAAGGILMLFGAGGLYFAWQSPYLVRRLREPGLAAGGGSVLCIALLILAFGSAWPLAAAGAFLAGVGFYMLHNTLQTNATQMAPERRGAAVAVFACCFFLGQSVGVGLAGIAVEHFATTWIIATGAFATLVIGLTFSRLVATHRAHG